MLNSHEWLSCIKIQTEPEKTLAFLIAAIVECRGPTGPLRQRRLPSPLVAGVFVKMKKLARLDVAERSHRQCGQVRLLNFHGGPADFEVTTGHAGKNETMTLRRL